MKEKLNKDVLLHLLDKIMNPKANGLTEQSCNDVLLAFCAGCPDPTKARWLVVECLDPMSDEELVERALAMPIASGAPTGVAFLESLNMRVTMSTNFKLIRST